MTDSTVTNTSGTETLETSSPGASDVMKELKALAGTITSQEIPCTRFTRKDFEGDYDFLLGIAQILALMNLYSDEMPIDNIQYLNAPYIKEEDAATPKAARASKRKQNFEDTCIHDTVALSTLRTVLVMLKPAMTNRGIAVGWDLLGERYVLLYRGKILDLKAIESE